jgi:hypothetical protein
MTAGALIVQLHAQGVDINLMMDEWNKLSKEKNYPRNEEGFRRYLTRATSGQVKLTKRKDTKESNPPSDPPPEEFIKWWESHPEGDNFAALVAWRCDRYRLEWKKDKAADCDAVGLTRNDAPF